MIKRCTNKEGVVTFNISFQGLRPNKSLSQDERDLSHCNDPYMSPKSLPMTPVNLNRSHLLRYASGSNYSDVDSADIEDAPQSAELSGRLFQNFAVNDENNYKGNSDDFMTHDPIDFDELQKFIKLDKDDEDKSSVSTLSKSSKKIAKGKVGYVYKESRFKEEAKIKGKRQPWQPYEDEKVLELVAVHGQSWALIASMMGGRTGKQIRDRYLNNLRPDIKNAEWTKKEDQQLIALFRQIGRKWSKIASLMQGRTEGQVKNRFYSYIQKKILPYERSEGVGTSPEGGEISPSSRIEGTMNGDFDAIRRSYHSQMNTHDFENLRYSHVTSNGDQPTCVDLASDLDFPEVEEAHMDCFGLEQNLADSCLSVHDPTDVIFYQGGEVKNIITLSPEKIFARNGFFPENTEFNGMQGIEDNNIHDPFPDNMSISDLAQEFKLHCQTNTPERDMEFNNNKNCIKPTQGMVYEFSGVGMKPLGGGNTMFRQAIHNSAQRK